MLGLNSIHCGPYEVSGSWNHQLYVSWLCWPSEIYYEFNPFRPRQNGCHFPDETSKCIFMNVNVWISHKISLKFVPNVRINNIPALVQIMAWHQPGAKPLSEPMMVNLLTHKCVTRPQWVKSLTITLPFSYQVLLGLDIHKYHKMFWVLSPCSQPSSHWLSPWSFPGLCMRHMSPDG